MFIQLILVASAFVATAVLTPVVRDLCRRLGWLDQPNHRKIHLAPIPRTGGIAILAGYAVAMSLLRWSPLWNMQPIAWSNLSFVALLPAVVTVFVTGLLDDVIGLRPAVKLGGQLFAAVLAVNAHVEIHRIGGHVVGNAWWQYLLTIAWLITCTNAFNLIDGVDGLATAVGLFASATAFLSGLFSGNVALMLVTAPLVGALLGFLPYNFAPASIFMGDCGSLTVGFLLGCFGVLWAQKSATLLGMTAPLIAMAIPLLDTALAVVRRLLRGQHIFAADRGHIHHRLLAKGFTPARIAYLAYASGGVLAGLSLLVSNTGASSAALIGFSATIWLTVRFLGYEEFQAARRMILGGFFQRSLAANLSLSQFERTLESARTVDECWEALVQTGQLFGLSTAILHLDGRDLKATLIEVSPAECWNLSIPLHGSGHVDLSAPFQHAKSPAPIGPLADTVRKALVPKLHELETERVLLAQKIGAKISANRSSGHPAVVLPPCGT